MKTAKCSCGEKFPVSETGRPKTFCDACIRAGREQRRRDRLRTISQPLPAAALDGLGMSREEVARRLQLDEKTVREAEGVALLKLRKRPDLLEVWRDWIEAGKPKPAVASLGARLLEFQESVVACYELQTNLLFVGEVAIAAECAQEIEPLHQKIGSVLQQLR